MSAHERVIYLGEQEDKIRIRGKEQGIGGGPGKRRAHRLWPLRDVNSKSPKNVGLAPSDWLFHTRAISDRQDFHELWELMASDDFSVDSHGWRIMAVQNYIQVCVIQDHCLVITQPSFENTSPNQTASTRLPRVQPDNVETIVPGGYRGYP